MEQKNLNILLVEDNPGDVFYFKEIFKKAEKSGSISRSFSLKAVSSVDGAVKLTRNTFDAILYGMDIEDIGRVVMEFPDTPVIAFAKTGSDAEAIESVKKGAQDCLTRKDISVGRLVCSIENSIYRHSALVSMRKYALVDNLTGLYNRHGFFTLADQQLFHASRKKRKVALFYIDLDGMKAINDSYGHSEGDAALIEATEVLKTTFRKSDIIARLGGDEFAVLALETDDSNINNIVSRLKSNVEVVNSRNKREHGLSLSIGTATYDYKNPIELEKLMNKADASMYSEKFSKKSLLNSKKVAV